MKFSIIIPCFNEEKNIPHIFQKFANALTNQDLELILVDNGSTDATQKNIKDLLAKYPFAKLVIVPKNQGYGFGILQGLKIATGNYLGWTHADLQTDPSDVIKAIEIIRKENREDLFLKGKRKGRHIFDLFFTFSMGLFETIYLRQNLFDINAQPNIFPARFFQSWQNPPNDFSLDLYALYMARKQKLKIIRFSVNFPPRIFGQSKWNTSVMAKWKFIKRTLEFSFKLKRKGIL